MSPARVTDRAPARAPSWRGGGAAPLAAVVAGAALLRLTFAWNKGLVLDELHSLFHASAADPRSFFEGLLRDNHPPLSFLLLASARRLLGESELALRTPAILFGLLNLVLVWRLARRAPWAGGAALAAAFLACSSLHLDVSTQARMYAFHALAVTGFLEALVSFLEAPRERVPREAGVWLVFWAVLGLHNHYYFLHYLFLCGVGVALACALAPHNRDQARRLVPYALAAALLAAPWYLFGFPRQLGHGLPPGMSRVTPARVAEALVHLLFVNVRIAGPGLRLVFVACGGLALVLALVGFARLWVARLQTHGVVLPLCLALAAFGAPVWAGSLAAVVPRAGFNWIYLTPSAPALAVLLAAASGPGRARLARALGLGAVLAACLVLAVLNALSPGTEDYRGAIRSILAAAGPHDAVVSVEWQPEVFDQGLAWRYYAPRLVEPGHEPPPRLAIAHYSLAHPEELAAYERVFLLRRSLPEASPLMELLRARYAGERSTVFGYGLWVHEFWDPSR